MPRRFTIKINQLPENTPPDASIYLAGTLNGWNPGSRHHKFQQQTDGKFYITFENSDPDFEFKITRGTWNKEEADRNGNRISNRSGYGAINDTLEIEVENWIDIPLKNQDKVSHKRIKFLCCK